MDLFVSVPGFTYLLSVAFPSRLNLLFVVVYLFISALFFVTIY